MDRFAWCVASCVAAVALLERPETARGAAFQLRETDTVAEGTAQAGAGSQADSPATVFANPAGMTQLPGVQVSLGSSLIAPSFTFRGSATDAFGLPIAGGGVRDGGNLGVVPQAYVTAHLSPDVSIGLGLTVPFGEDSYYGPGFVGRYLTDKTALETLDIEPAIAWRVTPWLSLGAGLSANYAAAEFTAALNSTTLAAAALGQPVSLPDGLLRFRGDDWQVGYNVGALLTPAPGTKIGLSYRSGIDHVLAGPATATLPGPLAAASIATGASVKLPLPATVDLSLTQALAPRWTGYAEFTWTNWSRLRSLDLVADNGAALASTREGYHDGFFVAFGASYQVTNRLTVRAGTAFDKTPATAAYLDVRLPDANRYWLAGGASYRLLPGTSLDFAYAHLFVDDSSIHALSPTDDLLVGRVGSHIDVVSLGARTQF